MKIGRLSAGQQSRLKAIGFEWDVLDPKWKNMFKELLKCKAEHRDTNVPTNWPTYLGTWVSLQRKARKAKDRGKLSLEREAKLNEIGFIWDALKFEWEKRY
jgi:hypothetical protein